MGKNKRRFTDNYPPTHTCTVTDEILFLQSFITPKSVVDERVKS